MEMWSSFLIIPFPIWTWGYLIQGPFLLAFLSKFKEKFSKAEMLENPPATGKKKKKKRQRGIDTSRWLAQSSRGTGSLFLLLNLVAACSNHLTLNPSMLGQGHEQSA